MEKDEMYQKVAGALKISGGDSVRRIAVTSFKGIPECRERLEQLKAILVDCELDYVDCGSNFFSVEITGNCDISFAETAEDFLDWNNDDYGFSEEEVTHFYEVVAQKNDLWGWLYKTTEFGMFHFDTILASLIAPDCPDQVTFTTIDEYGVVNSSTLHE